MQNGPSAECVREQKKNILTFGGLYGLIAKTINRIIKNDAKMNKLCLN